MRLSHLFQTILFLVCFASVFLLLRFSTLRSLQINSKGIFSFSPLASRLFLQSPANPDLLYIIFFCHTQLTVTLLLALIFGSKVSKTFNRLRLYYSCTLPEHFYLFHKFPEIIVLSLWNYLITYLYRLTSHWEGECERERNWCKQDRFVRGKKAFSACWTKRKAE